MKRSIHLISVSLVLTITLILVAVSASPVRADDLYVPSDYPTIQAAIDAAESGDTIHLAVGNYLEGLTIGKSLSIVGTDADQTILDGERTKRVVHVSAGDVTLSDLTIQNGYASAASNPQGKGGGIYNGGNVTVNRCTFSNNEATGDYGHGGAIYNEGKVTARNCTFTNNKTYGYGGAIDNYYYNPGVTGDDIFPSITCTNCVFTGNVANRGGAIGSLVYDYYPYVTTTPTVVTVTNCTFTGNFADYSGGGVYFAGGELKATNCTLSANHVNGYSYHGGGITAQSDDKMPETVATITNCILWGNTRLGSPYRDWDQMYIPANCSAAVTYSDVQGGQPGTGNLNLDPRFARNPDPADNDYSDNNGGDLHLQMNSPCIDVGNNDAVTETLDLDEDTRIQDGIVNMGAYESLAPAVNAGPDQSVEIAHDGNPATNTAQVTINGSASDLNDPDGLTLTYDWTEGVTGLGTGKDLIITLAEGKHTITLTVTAPDGDTATDQAVIQVLEEPNRSPIANAGEDQPEARNLVALNGSSSFDPDGDQLTNYEWSICILRDPGDPDKGYDCTFCAEGINPSVKLPVGTHIIMLEVTDPYGYRGSDDISLTVVNTAPAIGAITINPASPSPANTLLDATATFTDPDPNETHTAVWNWGDGSTSPGIVDEGIGSVSGSHTYTIDVTYTVTLTVTDANGGQGSSTCQYVVQSNRPSSFVTGGGWIISPAGAYSAIPSLTGKANFGFNSKYNKGANVPTGSTEFQFKAANLNFHSESYEWLVIDGAKAQYKGIGTINGKGNYGFMVTVIDGDEEGNAGKKGGGKGNKVTDKFRIKIWSMSNNSIVYDSQPGDPDIANPTTVTDRGSIIIHKK